MRLHNDFKNALTYLFQGNWDEFFLRVKVKSGLIDLKMEKESSFPTEKSHEYGNSGGIKLKKVMTSLNITEKDSILDYGSGKGGAMITFSKFPFSIISGVEISQELTEVAKKNMRNLKINNSNFFVCDAAEFKEIDTYNFFYFANPFPENVMNKVMNNIEDSMKRKKRKIHIIYGNPVFNEAIIKSGTFHLFKKFNFDPLPFYVYKNFM